ncbi:MAG: hypothetical protein KDD72_05130 [Anaerolineales bacterium]|nr:hypothetical protein [Anaerolineales bacterium]
MYRPGRFYRRRPRFHRPWRPFRGWIWIILLGLLFYDGGGTRWWPGFLIVVGIAVLFAAFFWRPPEPPPPHEPPPFDDHPPFDPPPPRHFPPAEAAQRKGNLPATCPNCGGPVRPNDVQWTGPNSAACSYCGSNLTAK